MRRLSIISLGSIVAGLAACEKLEAPETGATVNPAVLAAAYPDLLTEAQIAGLSPQAEVSDDLLDAQQDLASRAARLRARAAALNSQVLSDDDRAALQP